MSADTETNPPAAPQQQSVLDWLRARWMSLIAAAPVVLLMMLLIAYGLRGTGSIELRSVSFDGTAPLGVPAEMLKHVLISEQARLSAVARHLNASPDTTLFAGRESGSLILGRLIQERYNAVVASEPVPTPKITLMNTEVDSGLVDFLLRRLFRQESIQVMLRITPGSERVTALSDRGRMWSLSAAELQWLVPIICNGGDPKKDKINQSIENECQFIPYSEKPETATERLRLRVREDPHLKSRLMLEAIALKILLDEGANLTLEEFKSKASIFRFQAAVNGFPIDGSGELDALIRENRDFVRRWAEYEVFTGGVYFDPLLERDLPSMPSPEADLWSSDSLSALYHLHESAYIYDGYLDAHPYYGNGNIWCGGVSLDEMGILPLADQYWKIINNRIGSAINMLKRDIRYNNEKTFNMRAIKSILLAAYIQHFISDSCELGKFDMWYNHDQKTEISWQNFTNNGDWTTWQANWFKGGELDDGNTSATGLGSLRQALVLFRGLENVSEGERKAIIFAVKSLAWRTHNASELLSWWKALDPEDPDLFAELARREMQTGTADSIIKADNFMSRAMNNVKLRNNDRYIQDRLLIFQEEIHRWSSSRGYYSECLKLKAGLARHFGFWQYISISTEKNHSVGYRYKVPSIYRYRKTEDAFGPIKRNEVLNRLSKPCY